MYGELVLRAKKILSHIHSASWQPIKLGAMSAANIGSNLLFNWLIFTMLGPGEMTDALFAGLTLPQLFTAIVSSSLTHVLIPILTSESYEDQQSDAWTFFIYSAILFGIVSFLLIQTAKWWIPLTVPGFTAEAKLITIELASISIVSMVFTGISAIQAAVGYAKYKFVWVDTAPMIANLLSVLLLIWLLPSYGVLAAAWISVLRLLLQTLLLMPLMGKPRMPDLKRATVKVAWKRLKPILFGASYYKLDPLVDRFLLSTASAGSLSLMYLVQQLHSAACQIIAKAFAVPAITALAAAHKTNNQGLFFLILIRNICVIFGVCFLGILIIWMAGEIFLLKVMVHGEFSSADAREMWILLMLSAGMLFGGAMGSITAGAFYAQGDTWTPTWLGSLAFTIGIVLKIVMFKLYGFQGLAIAISAYYLISLCMQLFLLWKRYKISISRMV